MRSGEHRSTGALTTAGAFGPSHSTIGCFNCGRHNCTVSSCPEPRNAKRIADNLAAWRLLRRVPSSTRVNISTLADFADGNQEAGEVLFAASVLTKEEDEGVTDKEEDAIERVIEKESTDLINIADEAQFADAPFIEQADSHVLFVLNPARLITTVYKVPKGDYSSECFYDLCLDTGETRSVCGAGQTKAYCRLTGAEYQLQPAVSSFRFGDSSPKPSLGLLQVRVPLKERMFLSFQIDVVDADVPMIVGLDLLRNKWLRVDNLYLKLQVPHVDIEVPIKLRNGHLFYQWSTAQILYTTAELQRIHLHFAHPTAGKLFQLIQRANPARTTPEVRKMIEVIERACESCRSFQPPPFLFRASLPPDKLIFNEEVAMDLVFLEGVPVLHIVDTHTNFQNAVVLRSKKAQDIWSAFVECWASTYVGYPRTVRFDQEAGVTAAAFRDAATAHGIQIQFSVVASHNSIGVGERYHQPLRRVFRLLRERYPSIHPEILLRYAVKQLNDTAGPNRLVSTLLVFGSLPSFPLLSSNLPDQKSRMEAMRDARVEACNIAAEGRIKKALSYNTPPSASVNLSKGDKVRVYDETKKWWTPGYRIVEISGKQLCVSDGVRISQLHRANTVPNPVDTDERDFAVLLRRLKPFSQPIPTVLLTEFLQPNDARAGTSEFDEARAKEVVCLLDRGVFEILIKEYLPMEANVMGGRFLLAIRNVGTKEEVYKARFVVQGHTDSEKNFLVHTSATAKHYSIKLLVALAATFNLSIWTQDVAQAYVQGADEILRDVYVRGVQEFQLNSQKLFKVLLPLYGLADAGDYWFERFYDHISSDLNMLSMASDPCFFHRTVSGKLSALIASHVDDMLGARTPDFVKEFQRTEAVFLQGERNSTSLSSRE